MGNDRQVRRTKGSLVLVGAVGRHMKKGRHAASWCSALCMPTVGMANDDGPHSREA
jgi:hypothetical protein